MPIEIGDDVMLEQEYVEHLIKTANNVAMKEKEYRNAKVELEVLKAKYILENDWEKLLGKSKVTQKEKDAFVEVETEALKRKVDDLKIQVDYCKRMYEINLLSYKE